MTSRLVYEALLIELNKVGAPSIKLVEFNYYCNKAFSLYINKVYNVYDTNLQTSDDLRVLKTTAYLEPLKNPVESKYIKNIADVVELPQDYLHLLNCICIFKVNESHGCYKKDDIVLSPATRLTADSWGQIIKDIYNRPTPSKPYYYIHNQPNTDLDLTMNDSNKTIIDFTNPNTSKTFNFTRDLLVSKSGGTRISNVIKPTCEIRYGKQNSKMDLVEVLIDYIRSPQFIKLTQLQLDLVDDTSQLIEFPDYAILEMINELVTIVLERTENPRLQTNYLISLTIARPTQQLQQSALVLA